MIYNDIKESQKNRDQRNNPTRMKNTIINAITMQTDSVNVASELAYYKEDERYQLTVIFDPSANVV